MILKSLLIQGKNRGDDDTSSRRGDIVDILPYEQWQANDWPRLRPPNFYWLHVAIDDSDPQLAETKIAKLKSFLGADYVDEVIQVPDIQVVQVLPYEQVGTPILNAKGEHATIAKHIDNGMKEETHPRLVRKSAWNLNVDLMPQAAKTLIASRERGWLAIGDHPQADYSWAQLKTYLRRKRDNAEADSL